MERKIGKIFEYNGEWYQCVQGNCEVCDFSHKEYTCLFGVSNCVKYRKSNDGKAVAFRKLEKVGYINEENTIAIEIKQNEEDMEENKTPLPKEDNALTRTVYAYVNGKVSDKELIRSIKEMSDEYPYDKNGLKPFSLEAAKAGKPVCTRDGRKARIICFDAKGDKPIIALIEMGVAETPNNYPIDGKAIPTKETPCDLMILSEKKEGWVNIYHDKEGNIYTDENVYNTEKDAINFCPHDKCRVATVKIEWEE